MEHNGPSQPPPICLTFKVIGRTLPQPLLLGVSALRVLVIGGGPGGIYTAILLKRRHPDAVISVHERNRADDTFGWGVVLSDQTVDNLRAADPESGRQIAEALHRWDDIAIHFGGKTIRSGGHGFSGIGRKQLLAILQERCAALGVVLHFEQELPRRPRCAGGR